MINKALCAALILSIICNVVLLYPRSQGSLQGTARRALRDFFEKETKSQTIDGVEVAAGTRKVFIDLGANDGSSTSFFLNGGGGGGVHVQGGDKGSVMEGLGWTKDWEIIMFEANANHTAKLDALKEDAMSKSLAKSITIYNGTAITPVSGPITFIIDHPITGDAGSTIMAESGSAHGKHFTIPGMGILDLFHLLKIHHDDFVVVKMDIEGAEFDVLREMIVHGAYGRVDIMAVEYHDTNPHVFGRGATRAKYVAQHQCLDWMVEGTASNTKVVHWGRRR